MDVLTAHTLSGFLHAVTCDVPKGFGLGFERNMAAQGLTVTRYSHEAYAALQKERSQTAQKPAQTQAIRTLESEYAWPEIGQNIVHHVIGYATITHTVTLDDRCVPVATGPKGQGLVQQGKWRVATEADKPYWMRSQDDMSSKTANGRHEAPICRKTEHVLPLEPEKTLVPVSTVVDISKSSRMVGLFELEGSA